MKKIRDSGKLPDLVGEKISLDCSRSEVPWQHLVGFFKKYPNAEYIDCPEGPQIMGHFKELYEIEADKPLQITGKVVKVEGRPKRPRSKTDEKYVEYQILVDEWQYK